MKKAEERGISGSPVMLPARTVAACRYRDFKHRKIFPISHGGLVVGNCLSQHVFSSLHING